MDNVGHVDATGERRVHQQQVEAGFDRDREKVGDQYPACHMRIGQGSGVSRAPFDAVHDRAAGCCCGYGTGAGRRLQHRHAGLKGGQGDESADNGCGWGKY
ncbi:hypothetical protein [Streptomyces halstedii]|uniref:Uncharacterized protein n=1 Tax=Streptomyces halstedii TaxID=1944 RepID=A0A6N9U817_STRHA|nr:hypothetical protein [Streptomyces halstedii]NEA19758.1 hypothetical protein [Streptomyces halstedii]